MPRSLQLLVALCLVLFGSASRADVLPLGSHLLDLRAEQAIALLPRDASPLVAVLDTGFQLSHPALRGRLVTGYNVFTGGTDVGLKASDPVLYTHGTAVASIISADALLTVWPRAVFPQARILPIKVCCTDASNGTRTNSELLRRGILYAAGIPDGAGKASTERARVINISFVLSDQYDLSILDAIEQATQAGSIIVIAVGEGSPQISEYLAQMPGVVGVMVAADGSSRPLTDQPIPVIPAPGTGILALMPTGTVLAPLPSMAPVSGSSFATAVASAVAAMVVVGNPNLSPAEVASILASDSIYDAQGLDALRAVQKADELPLPPSSGGGSASDGAAGGGAMGWLTLLILLFCGSGVSRDKSGLTPLPQGRNQ
jgi:hypothetical protein